MLNIVICGGHLAPALAVIEKLSVNKKYKIYYFGRMKALEGDEAKSLEYNAITKLNISFISIVTGRLQRSFTKYSFSSILKLPIGFIHSFILLLMIRPKVVVSFGGYLALPVSLCAWLLGIPVITHEQTHSLGLANNIISRIAKILCLSYQDTTGVPDRVKTKITGNPVRNSILNGIDNQILNFGDNKLPLIYITGGNLGSRFINETIGKILPNLTPEYRILHQCGNADENKDFKYLSDIKLKLPDTLKNNYYLMTQIDPSFVGAIYKNAQLVIGRAGANTVNEVLLFRIPALFIPLPWAGQKEQVKNAQLVKSSGLGEIMNQSEVTPEMLLDKIKYMLSNNFIYRNNEKKVKKIIIPESAQSIVKLIDGYCG